MDLSELVVGKVEIVAFEKKGLSFMESHDGEEGGGVERNLHCTCF